MWLLPVPKMQVLLSSCICLALARGGELLFFAPRADVWVAAFNKTYVFMSGKKKENTTPFRRFIKKRASLWPERPVWRCLDFELQLLTIILARQRSSEPRYMSMTLIVHSSPF